MNKTLISKVLKSHNVGKTSIVGQKGGIRIEATTKVACQDYERLCTRLMQDGFEIKPQTHITSLISKRIAMFHNDTWYLLVHNAQLLMTYCFKDNIIRPTAYNTIEDAVEEYARLGADIYVLNETIDLKVGKKANLVVYKKDSGDIAVNHRGYWFLVNKDTGSYTYEHECMTLQEYILYLDVYGIPYGLYTDLSSNKTLYDIVEKRLLVQYNFNTFDWLDMRTQTLAGKQLSGTDAVAMSSSMELYYSDFKSITL